MKVLNINESIRNYLSENIIYDNILRDEKYESNNTWVIELYNSLRDKDYFDYLMGIIFETSYMLSSFTCSLFPEDEEEKNRLNFFSGFNSLDEFTLTVDEEVFAYLFEDIPYFNSLDLFSKKEIINNSLKQKEILNKIFPCYLLDVLYYLNPINSEEILGLFYENYKLLKDRDTALEDTICQGVDGLIELENQDFYNYKHVVLDILEEYYKYNIYLLFNDIVADEYSSEIVEMIENDLDYLVACTVDNSVLLEPIIRSYLEYNILPEDEKQK